MTSTRAGTSSPAGKCALAAVASLLLATHAHASAGCTLLWPHLQQPSVPAPRPCALGEASRGSWTLGDCAAQAPPGAFLELAARFRNPYTFSFCAAERQASLLGVAFVPRAGCSLRPFDQASFLAAFAGKTLAFVGDSVTHDTLREFVLYATVAAATSQEREQEEQQGQPQPQPQPAAAWRRCLDDPNPPPFWDVAGVQSCEELVPAAGGGGGGGAVRLLYVPVKGNLVDHDSARLVTEAGARACRARVAANASADARGPPYRLWGTRGAPPGAPPACHVHAWQAVVPHAEVLVLNYGHHGDWWNRPADDYAKVQKEVAAMLAASFVGSRLVFVETTLSVRPPGWNGFKPSEGCVNDSFFRTELEGRGGGAPSGGGADPVELPWEGWSWPAASFPPSFRYHYLSLASLNRRTDGHVDCVHFCPLGPLMWVARWLTHVLLANG